MHYTNQPPPLMNSTLTTLILASALSFTVSSHAQSVSLDFSQPVGSPDGTNGLGGLSYFRGSSLDFLNVASSGAVSLDLRVTATAWGGGSFGVSSSSGHYADYSTNSGQPNDDLGVYYHGASAGLGGIHYDIEFFLGGSSFSTPYTVGQLDLLLYDVDGESSQSEMLRAYTADGLVSYRTGSDASSVTAAAFDGGVLFTGPGTNYPETDVSGAFILTYRDTNSIRLDFESNTISGMPNPVFSAIDGDLSLLNGDLSGFGPAQSVPEPSGALLMALAGLIFQLRRRKQGVRLSDLACSAI
jgi:hypothetical protein